MICQSHSVQYIIYTHKSSNPYRHFFSQDRDYWWVSVRYATV